MHRAPLFAVVLAFLPLATPAQRASVGAGPEQRVQMPPVPEGATEVEIKTKDSLTLRGAYFEPRKSSQLAPGAILVHDSGAAGGQMYDLADRMQKTGFAVLVVDLRGHGRSASKDLDWRKLNDDGKKAAWALAVRDLAASSAWLRDRKEVHATNLTIVGYRAGCALAARYTLRDENVRSVALVEPSPEELGINLAGDLTELGGLPTYIVSCKDAEKSTEAMIAEAHLAVGGHPSIELMVCSARKVDEPPALDRKAVAGIAKWTKDKAFPKK
jgi:pimeloyl-ACP methyl ester carboxylesterase